MNKIFKNYKKWMKVKSAIHNNGKFRKINEGDVVWAAVGENVGVEIDGKNEKFSRPVVVLKKHSALCFTGIPLTSRPHEGSWYASFEFQGRAETAVLIQARLFDVSRVYNRLGELPSNDYEMLRQRYLALFKPTKKCALALRLGSGYSRNAPGGANSIIARFLQKFNPLSHNSRHNH